MSEPSINKAGIIKVSNSENPKTPYLHQAEAIKALDKKVNSKNIFKGLLVIPTGGGKTFTAMWWLLRNVIDKDKKVLWIAHRHELLNQALTTLINNSYSNILERKKEFKYRVISGVHDRTINIEPDDDFIIASKDSINYGLEDLKKKWVYKNKNKIVLVIDEAHHAVAKSYVKIIKEMEEINKEYFKLIGLTATPFRTSEKEKGALKKIFEDDIIYSVDLKTLINRGILSEPIFVEKNTKIDMVNDLTNEDIRKIQRLSKLPEDVATKIAQNKVRNNIIVNHYVDHKAKYGKTLVFALNVQHAIELNGIFKKYGVKSDFVVSDIRDMFTNVTISKEENLEKIRKFRDGELEVLINVEILVEGVDVPNIKTVFLTRPTISTTLMTQMIGRGLRGEKAGGTKEAYIVSFIDDWKDKIAWVNPETLHEGEGVVIEDSKQGKEYMVRLIAINKIEEFARMMDDTVDTDELADLPFIERIPVGIYSFTVLLKSEDEVVEKNCDVMVYDCYKQAYEDFISKLGEIFKQSGLEDKEYLEDYELDYLCERVKKDYFQKYDTIIGYRDEDIKDILRYYAQTSSEPVFLPFEDREKYDIFKIACHIWEEDMGERRKAEYLDELWNDEKSFLKIFFGGNKRYFIWQIENELYKIRENGPTPPPPGPPVVEEKIDMKKLTLWEIRKKDYNYWKELTNAVYEKFRDEEGYYFSAESGWRSKKKSDFQIDHILPMACGGLTELSNLQLLTREENLKKAAKCNKCRGKYECDIKKKKVINTSEINVYLEKVYNKIDDLMKSGNITEAIDYLNDQIKEKKIPELYNELGNIYFSKEDYEKALEEYEKALEIDENHIESLYNKANVLFKIYGDSNNAIKLLNKALEIDQNNYQVLTFLGEIYLLKRKLKKALDCFTKSVSLNEDNYLGYFGIGNVYCAKENYDKAISYYNKAIEINSEIAAVYNMRGLCYKKLRKYDKVLDDFYKAIELDPKYANAYFNLADELDRKRRYEDAVKYYKKVVELNPLDDMAYNNMGYSYFKMKKYENALECYEKALEINPNNKYAVANKKQVEVYLKNK